MAYEVNMNVVKAVKKNREELQWSSDMVLNLGCLAQKAGFRPNTHLFV